MTNNQLSDIKNALNEFGEIVSRVVSPEMLVWNTPGFGDAYSRVCKSLGVLENAWIMEDSSRFNSRDAINRVVDQIDVVKKCVKDDIKLPNGDSIIDRMSNIKVDLKEINKHLNGGEK